MSYFHSDFWFLRGLMQPTNGESGDDEEVIDCRKQLRAEEIAALAAAGSRLQARPPNVQRVLGPLEARRS